MNNQKVSLVHDWLTGMRGGERCLESFAKMFPQAPIHTLIHVPKSVSETIEKHPIIASPLSKFSWARKHYRKLLPIFPWATRQIKMADCELVVSLSHCIAKAVQTPANAKHICYCFTPARYLWDHADTYLDPQRSSWPVRIAAKAFLPRLQKWDLASAQNVDHFVAISSYVAERIQRIYQRESQVIYPPVELKRFEVAPIEEVEDHYLLVSALVPYKGVDLAIEAFNKSGLRLHIIGKGPQEKRLKAMAKENIDFLGWKSDDYVARAMARCRAFLLPCEEDFGITPLEAMASGRPVIALGKGGALETVIDPTFKLQFGETLLRPCSIPTGYFFEEAEADSLALAVEKMQSSHHEFDSQALRKRAAEFDESIFHRELQELVQAHGFNATTCNSTDTNPA